MERGVLVRAPLFLLCLFAAIYIILLLRHVIRYGFYTPTAVLSGGPSDEGPPDTSTVRTMLNNGDPIDISVWKSDGPFLQLP